MAAAEKDGIEVARCTVERLMRGLGIAGVGPRRKRPRTTLPAPAGQRPADRQERDFSADVPNRWWAAGITCVDTPSGFVYAALVTDLFSRRIAGWQVAGHLRAELAFDALEMVIWPTRGKLDGRQLVRHSDRGCQYTAITCTERLAEIGAACPVGSKDNFYVNAAAESVNSLQKKELIGGEGPWEGGGKRTLATLEWVSWYNSERLHSFCGYLSPDEYEENYYGHQEPLVG